MDECPCETCLVRAICRSRVVKRNKSKFKRLGPIGEYLVIEYLEECPMIVDYFSVVNEKVIHTYKKIHKVCKCMNVLDSYFVWHANELEL